MLRVAYLSTLIAILLSGATLADGRTATPRVPEFAVVDRTAPTDPMPERETRWLRSDVTLTDVVYVTRPGYRPLHLDLYREAGAGGARPLIVVLHGGGWAHANPRVGAAFANFPDVLAYVARRGYVVAAISYRFSGEAPFPAPVDDLQAALQFLREGASRFGIDPRRVALWGLSSGAQIAGLAAVTCRSDACPQAFAGWFGLYDFGAYLAESLDGQSVRDYLRCPAEGCPDQGLASASPLRQVRSGAPPALLIHGATDSAVPATQSERFAAALRDAGVDASLIVIPGVGHGFIAHEAVGTQAALRTALAETLSFFDRSLGVSPMAPSP